MRSSNTTDLPMVVLAVDDDTAMLSSISRILRRSGVGVCCAASGAKGMAMLNPWLPELVLLDSSMPKMSGYAFLRRFRRKEQDIRIHTGSTAPLIPVLFVSGQSGHRQRIDGLNAGAVDYLVKPFDPEELRARVCAQLRHRRQASAAGHKISANTITPFAPLANRPGAAA